MLTARKGRMRRTQNKESEIVAIHRRLPGKPTARTNTLTSASALVFQ
jgi:hypothetical protein